MEERNHPVILGIMIPIVTPRSYDMPAVWICRMNSLILSMPVQFLGYPLFIRIRGLTSLVNTITFVFIKLERVRLF